MKIGRNDLCVCGSGKKYKKCCLNKENKETSKNIKKILFSSNIFLNIEKKVTGLENIFNEYRFCDLVIAIYSINISLDNRSALENSLALNATLLSQNNFGEKTISNYEEFTSFFNRIAKKIPITIYDDYTIEDFGEIKFNFCDKTYSVITGTGHNNVFACLQFLPKLVRAINKEKELIEILEYNEGVINFFKGENISKNDNEVKYVIPSRELFYKTQKFFCTELEKYSIGSISKVLEMHNYPIEKRHFIHKDGKIYPLYNTSLLVDVYSSWIKNVTEDKKSSLINYTIVEIINELTKFDENKYDRVLYPVSMIKDNENISKFPYTFCAVVDTGVILAINKSMYSDNELKNELKKIESLHKSDQLKLVEVISRNNDGKRVGISINNNSSLSMILYDNYTDVTEGSLGFKERDEKYFHCSALDIIYYLYFMNNFEELKLYLSKKDENDYDRLLSFGGASSEFIAWKESNYMFSKGAIKYGLVNLGYNTEVSYVWDYYKEKLSKYPWGVGHDLFKFPFVWNIEEKENGYFQYVNKLTSSYGGLIKKFDNNCFIFFSHDFKFYDGFSQKQIEVINFIDELNSRKLNNCEAIFVNSKKFSNLLIEVLYIPNTKQNINMNSIENNQKKYVYSDMEVKNDHILIKYSVNIEKLYKDIEKTENRDIETKYFLELFKPIEKLSSEDYLELTEFLNNQISFKKEVGVFSLYLDYYWSDKSYMYKIDDTAYISVRKDIANLCYAIGIEPSVYKGKQATTIIRKMQGNLIKRFEEVVSLYDRDKLHIILLSMYASSIHNVNTSMERYNNNHNIDENIAEEIKEKILNLRENERYNIRCLQYLIETNLNLDRKVSRVCTNEENQFLIAFANWLVVLQDNADLCFNSEKESYIEINHEFIVDVLLEEDIQVKNEELKKRTYNNNDYTIKFDDEDKIYTYRAIEAFKVDTGLEFEKMLNILQYLQLEFLDCDYSEIIPNVFEIEIEKIIQGIEKWTEDKMKKQEIISLLNSLVIDIVKLKLWKGELRSFIPINEREQRDNRFDVKPLVRKGSKIIFSPIVMKELHNRWKNGLVNFYLPYEIGLNNVMDVLKEWKKRYENLMVFDIANIFNKYGFKNIFPNVKLHSLDKKHNHPQKLGDYDLIVIDEKKLEIWLIESKVLSKVGSIHEMQMQQTNFFLNHKYDEKFQRRIDYMEIHYKKILNVLNMDFSKEYKIRSYMVTNKILFSRYKKIKYPIVTIYELDRIISDISAEIIE